MRIFILVDDYLPASTRVAAKMIFELAEEFERLGHEAIVVTPDSTVKSGFLDEVYNGVRVLRFSSGKLKDVGLVKRALNESLLSLRAWHCLRNFCSDNPPELVVYYSPSIFWGPFVSWLKYRAHAKAYLILRDLFPQWIIDSGMIKPKSLIAKYFRFFEKYSYQQANKIGLMSIANEEVFRQLNGMAYPSEILPNWVKLELVDKQPELASKLRANYNLHGKVIFFYGGNIGKAQDMTNLMRLARNMKSHTSAHFLFVGQGDEYELIFELKKQWGLGNVTILPSVDQESFKEILKQVDVGLFSLAKSHSAHNFPGKLLGYMGNHIPILGSVNSGNDLGTVINDSRSGFIVDNGEDELLNDCAVKLMSADLRIGYGKNAYALAQREFSVESCARQILGVVDCDD